ncbi:MAG: hypothetical protein HY002_01405 [Candidatus Rokubacteria bacterium]|nr:hypothetical protein [Candidatus Rokubacteria bacterium]
MGEQARGEPERDGDDGFRPRAGGGPGRHAAARARDLKGAGETGTIASTAAKANAVLDALAPLGIRHLDMPLSADKLWAAIQAARGRPGAAVRPAR